MAYEAQLVIQSELDSGEELLWAGTPKQSTVFRPSDVFMIPFSLLWGGFAIFWEIMALGFLGNGAGSFNLVFPLFGIPFVIVGLYMIFGRFIYDAKKRSKTFYGLTDQRAIIVSGIFSKSVKSLNLKTMSDVSLTEKSSGNGTITFGQEDHVMSMFMGGGLMGAGGSLVPKFELVEDAKQVYNKLRM